MGVTLTVVTGDSSIYHHEMTTFLRGPLLVFQRPIERVSSSTVRDCLSASSPCLRMLLAVVTLPYRRDLLCRFWISVSSVDMNIGWFHTCVCDPPLETLSAYSL